MENQEKEIKTTNNYKERSDIFSLLILTVLVYGVVAVFATIIFNGSSRFISLSFAVCGVFFIYLGIKAFADKEYNLPIRLYLIIAGSAGILPFISYLTGWF